MRMSLKFVLLTLLNKEPASGYDLVRTFDSAVGYFWNASHQQVYRELGVLSDAKLVRFKQVKQVDKPDKKIYSISATGKRALHDWLEDPLKKQKTKDLLLVKLLSTTDENAALMQAELKRLVANSQQLQATYQDIESTYYTPTLLRAVPDDGIMVYAALRKGILSIEAHLTWLEEVQMLITNRFGV